MTAGEAEPSQQRRSDLLGLDARMLGSEQADVLHAGGQDRHPTRILEGGGAEHGSMAYSCPCRPAARNRAAADWATTCVTGSTRSRESVH